MSNLFSAIESAESQSLLHQGSEATAVIVSDDRSRTSRDNFRNLCELHVRHKSTCRFVSRIRSINLSSDWSCVDFVTPLEFRSKLDYGKFAATFKRASRRALHRPPVHRWCRSLIGKCCSICSNTTCPQIGRSPPSAVPRRPIFRLLSSSPERPNTGSDLRPCGSLKFQI